MGGMESQSIRLFSDTGRPSPDGRLVIEMLILKHMIGLSDEEIVPAVQENPSM